MTPPKKVKRVTVWTGRSRQVGECAEAIKALRAELARVTAERDRWYTDTIHTCHDACPRIACVQRREIAALKAALRTATRSNT